MTFTGGVAEGQADEDENSGTILRHGSRFLSWCFRKFSVAVFQSLRETHQAAQSLPRLDVGEERQSIHGRFAQPRDAIDGGACCDEAFE